MSKEYPKHLQVRNESLFHKKFIRGKVPCEVSVVVKYTAGVSVVHKQCGAQTVWCSKNVVHKQCGAQRVWCTNSVVHKQCGAQTVWCTNSVVLKECGAQTVWCTNSVVLKQCGAQIVWCSKSVVHKECGAQRVWCSNSVVHKQCGVQNQNLLFILKIIRIRRGVICFKCKVSKQWQCVAACKLSAAIKNCAKIKLLFEWPV